MCLQMDSEYSSSHAPAVISLPQILYNSLFSALPATPAVSSAWHRLSAAAGPDPCYRLQLIILHSSANCRSAAVSLLSAVVRIVHICDLFGALRSSGNLSRIFLISCYALQNLSAAHVVLKRWSRAHFAICRDMAAIALQWRRAWAGRPETPDAGSHKSTRAQAIIVDSGTQGAYREICCKSERSVNNAK